MEPLFAALVAMLFAAAAYLMTSRSLIRLLLGVVVLGNGVNLVIFTAGRITREAPPLIAETADTLGADVANPLPQALILTAIVISFSFFAFLLVLAFRAYQEMGTDDVDEIRVAEPIADPGPPAGY
jgi:multicomponent Na+:H+ antiporter subunit C